MTKKTLIPTTILLLQIIAMLFLLYEYQFGHSHIPVAFILLNILSLFSGFILIFSWFFYCKAKEKMVIWKLIIGISIATILLLVGVYISMGIDKYH